MAPVSVSDLTILNVTWSLDNAWHCFKLEFILKERGKEMPGSLFTFFGRVLP